MVVGYVRLSRDDDKKNYSSIENQKALIQAHAVKLGYNIDKFYEDDGVSGYIVNRPAFSEMLDSLENDIDIVIAKDLSRIGRNNAKVLMLLDRFQELEKRLILIDDNYDTAKSDDDIIGIKTWYNERYVKDTSKKIKSIVKMKQKEGKYICNAPFGYYIKNKEFYIRENEAEVVKKIFNLYIGGYGYRNISNKLNDDGTPTPSVLIMQNAISEGKTINNHVATKWSDNMIRDILKNDFYVGVFRNNKRERKTIHGTDKRISKSDHYVFKEHHEKLIEDNIFELAQELMISRKRSNYRGTKNNNEVSKFGSVLYCNDCGSRLTPITRENPNGIRRYYVCTKYNSYGKKYCSAHLIDENKLEELVITYINLCKNTMKDLINTFNIDDYQRNKDNIQKDINTVSKKINESKEKLKSIISMKLNDISKYGDNLDIIEETYTNMQNETMNIIKDYEIELLNLQNKLNESFERKHEDISISYKTLSEIGNIIERVDVEKIIQKIVINIDSMPEVYLKNNINDYIGFNVVNILRMQENNIIKTVCEIIRDEERSYTSAKYIAKKLNECGISKTKKSVMPYINLAIAEDILLKTEDPLKPYTIIASKDRIQDVINCYIDTM